MSKSEMSIKAKISNLMLKIKNLFIREPYDELAPTYEQYMRRYYPDFKLKKPGNNERYGSAGAVTVTVNPRSPIRPVSEAKELVCA